jgi:long-chain acyl-CoA synthetase
MGTALRTREATTATRTPLRIEGDTIVETLVRNGRQIPDRPAARFRRVVGWETLTWRGYVDAISEVTAGLAELGMMPGDRIGVFSNNRVEWHLADLGTLANGSVTVPLYQTSSPDQVAYVLGNAEARACFVEGDELLARILEVRDQLPKLDHVIAFDPDDAIDDPFVMGMTELRAIGAARLAREPGLFNQRAAAVHPEQLATLVYTSGTTGPPKGTMISHANIMWTLRSAVAFIDIHEGERFLSFLPLSHIAERMISDFGPIGAGGETWFARSLATVPEDLRDCRPTVFFAVPRVWEKLQEAVLGKLVEAHGLQKAIVDGYLALGHSVEHHGGTHAPLWEKLPYDALDVAVGRKIRHELGLDQARVLITAAAPIHPDVIHWFHGIGLPVVELYGQTEVCGPTTCNPPDDNRVGTVGRPLPGVSVRIADDGEILVKGGNVALGYFHDPAATAALIDADGWMHSGDAGAIDADGYLRITGRKKDLIITAAGQNITPQEIETDLRNHELVGEAVVVGEGRRYLTALIALDTEAVSAWAEAHHRIGSVETLAADPDLRAEIDRIVEEVNGRHARVEGIRKHRILAHELTIVGGELTPTLKVKRAVVNAKYADLIEEMYEEG